MPPWRPGWRVSRSQRRAACHRRAAALRDTGAKRAGPATLPRQMGQGERDFGLGKPGKAGRAAESERTKDLRGCSATRPEAARRGHNPPVASKGLAKFGEVGKSLDRQIR